MKASDISGFVENELEESSPISPALLKWSYVKINNSVLIFASTSERLIDAGYTQEQISSADYAVPEAALYIKVKFQNGWNIIRGQKSLSAILVENGKWVGFQSSRINVGDIAEQVESFAKECGATSYSYYSLNEFKAENFSFVKISLKGDTGKLLSGNLNAAISWRTLDIRDLRQLSKIKSNNIKKFLVGLLVKSAPVLLCVLLALNIAVYFKKDKLKKVEDEIALIAPEAKKLEKISEQINIAKNISEKKLFNALMLARINSVRPQGVVFLRSDITSPLTMEISGKATSLSLINDYLKSLREQSFIELANCETSSKGGEAKFTLKIKFKG